MSSTFCFFRCHCISHDILGFLVNLLLPSLDHGCHHLHVATQLRIVLDILFKYGSFIICHQSTQVTFYPFSIICLHTF